MPFHRFTDLSRKICQNDVVSVTEKTQELMTTLPMYSVLHCLSWTCQATMVMTHTLWSSPWCFPSAMEGHGDRDGDTKSLSSAALGGSSEPQEVRLRVQEKV